jgi:hypothetical protein
LFFVCGSVALAQVNEQKQDTTKTGYSIGKVQIKNPQSVSAYNIHMTGYLIVDGFSVMFSPNMILLNMIISRKRDAIEKDSL